MRIETLKKHRNLLVTIFQTIIVVGIAFIITIVSCKFKIEEFNWLTFIFNFVFTTIMKASYTSYAKEKEMMTDEVVLLTATIANDRKVIFNLQKTDDFEKEIERRNKINKLEAYINKLDVLISKQQKERKEKIEERNWAFDYKQALIKNENTEEFERIRSINSVTVDYEHIEASKLFTYGANAKVHKRKYTFSSWGASFSRAIVPVTFSIVLSLIFGLIGDDGSALKTGQVWIDLAGYLLSIILGIWWGWNNGKAIIREDYMEVLNNIASLIRDVKNKIGITEKEEK